MGQILALTEQYDLKGWGAQDVKSWQVLGDASQLAFADRGLYMADQDYVPVPTQGLLDKAYLAERAKLIQPGKALTSAPAGNPLGIMRSYAARSVDRTAFHQPL